LLSHFSPFSSSQYRGYIRNEWLDTGLLDWLAQLPDSLTRTGITTIKDSKTTSLFRVAISDQQSAMSHQLSAISFQPNPALCIKRYNYQNYFYALKYFFRSSRAKKAWKNANVLLSRGILTPSPLVFAEKRTLHFLHHSLFITAWIYDAVPLDSFFENKFQHALTGDLLKEKWGFIADAARYVKTIHNFQIAHGDMKAKNILVKTGDGQHLFFLLDLDSLKIKKSLSRKERIRDLARLNASFLDTRLLSRSDRMRFLITYLSEDPQTGSPKRIYWREIAATTENQLRKSGKRFM
jgi:tRNA A-37 threonylcarbamoyl transferase component Bud32